MTIRRYIEERSSTGRTDAVIADIVRHFHARYPLGPAILLCDLPDALMVVERHWLRLSRTLQKRRGASANPIEILKYTYTISTMQHVRLSAELPEMQPGALLYVLRPDQLSSTLLPAQTLYVADSAGAHAAEAGISRLAADSLVVDFSGTLGRRAAALGLIERSRLELAAREAWQGLERYLAGHHIEPVALAGYGGHDFMDDAVDRLLGDQVAFLELAGQFQQALDAARPLLTTPKQLRDQYEIAILLAHRVQTFAATGFSARFLHTYANDDFLMHDRPEDIARLAALIGRHMAAGRYNLAAALRRRPAVAWAAL